MLCVSGRISLDLAHTGNQREGKTFERLHTIDDLVRWFQASPLKLSVEITDDDLFTAYELRDAMWYGANSIRQSGTLDAKHITTLNNIARFPTLTPQLSPGLNKIWGGDISARGALSLIAHDGIELFASGSEIKQCANPYCPLLFVDGSRPGKRRWCSMERCGNMTKTAHYRRKVSKLKA